MFLDVCSVLAVNPTNIVQETFEYPTRFLNKLDRKHFTIECISKKKKRRIGAVTLNLHDIASGVFHIFSPPTLLTCV